MIQAWFAKVAISGLPRSAISTEEIGAQLDEDDSDEEAAP
jgi:hypothetical protein